MTVRTAPERPMIFAVALPDRQIVDAGDPPAHQPILVEFPVLIAVAAKPLAAVVVPLIGKAHRDAVLAKRPELLDEAVLELAVPFARQKRFDAGPALDELRAIAPAAVGGVSRGHPRGVARIPCIFRQTYLRGGPCGAAGRQRR